MRLFALALFALWPAALFAAELTAEQAFVPLAPPTAKVHAAYMTLTNAGDTPAQIIGVSAQGYAMAHLHQSVEIDGVVSMQSVHMIKIAPGQSVAFEQGGLHIMLMRPEASVKLGDVVEITLELADGETFPVLAKVASMKHTH